MYNNFGISEKDRHTNFSINILDASSILWFQLFPRGTDVVCCFPENSYVTVFGSCLNITCYSRIYQKGGLNQWFSVLLSLYKFVFRVIRLQNILLPDKLKTYTEQYYVLLVNGIGNKVQISMNMFILVRLSVIEHCSLDISLLQH